MAKPTTRYRYGFRDPEAKDAHIAYQRKWRSEKRKARWGDPQGEEIFLQAIKDGIHVYDVLEAFGITKMQLWGRAQSDKDFGERLEQALMEGRDETLEHGRAWTYIHHKCRCKPCRRANHGRYQYKS